MRHITKTTTVALPLFSVFCKVFEMILLRKLEQIAEEKGYFSHMQFGFREGVGCLQASYVICESINRLPEKGGKVFACFLDVRKAFDTVWITGLLYKLKHELGIDSQLWLVIRELYKDVRGQVLFNGHVSDSFDILQGSGQGRRLAPFLYKVFINQLLRETCHIKLGASLFNYDLSCPSFADDMTLVSCYPSSLNVLMQLAYQYSCNWRYQFSYAKTSVVAFGEFPAEHSKNKQTRNWSLGPDHTDEKDEYVNLGVYKNYCGSFSENVDENIAKTRKKAGMLFSANIIRKCVNPMIYLKFWKQACIPTLLFGAEIWSLTSTHLEKLERGQEVIPLTRLYKQQNTGHCWWYSFCCYNYQPEKVKFPWQNYHTAENT